MAVIQSIQTRQFALESSGTAVHDEQLRAARLTVVSMGLRDGASLTDIRETLQALGLA